MDHLANIIRQRLYDHLVLHADDLRYDAVTPIPINIRMEVPEDGYSIKEMPVIGLDLPQMEDYQSYDYNSVRTMWSVPFGIFDCTEIIFEKKQADEERLMNVFARVCRVIANNGVGMRDYLVLPHFVTYSSPRIDRLPGGISALFTEIQLPVISTN